MRYERGWRFFGTAAVVILISLGLAAFMFVAYDTYGWARLTFVDWGMYGAMNLAMLGVVILSLASIYLSPKSVEISSGRCITIGMFSGKRFVLDDIVSCNILPRHTLEIHYRKGSGIILLTILDCASFKDSKKMLEELRSTFG